MVFSLKKPIARFLGTSAVLGSALLMSDLVVAGPRDVANQIFNRLNGVPPSAAKLDELEKLVADGKMREAALSAINDPSGMFYNITLRNVAAQWSNPDKTTRVPLNDFVATVVGMVRDDIPFNQVLSADILYTANVQGAPAYSLANNQHYEFVEGAAADLRNVLTKQTQSVVSRTIPAEATAGVMTTRGFADSYYKAGTNRRGFAFVVDNFLCRPMETLQDTTRPDFRIRRDVTRAPGGDTSLFRNKCAGCHTGMDPLAGAFAYYDFNDQTTSLVYTPNQVRPKYNRNASEFPDGYVTVDDSWINLWTEGQNTNVGWSGDASGNGAKSLGTMLTSTQAFSSCMAKRAVEALCLRPVVNQDDVDAVAQISSSFKSSNYNLKNVYADAAVHCSK